MIQTKKQYQKTTLSNDATKKRMLPKDVTTGLNQRPLVTPGQPPGVTKAINKRKLPKD